MDKCEGSFSLPLSWEDKCDICGETFKAHFTELERLSMGLEEVE